MEAPDILVADRLIEIDLVDKTMGSFVTTAWQKYKVICEEIRAKHSDPSWENIFNGWQNT